MKKNINLLLLFTFFFPITFAEEVFFEIKEGKEPGMLSNNCNENNFYSALYSFDESFRIDIKNKYEMIESQSIKINEISSKLYPDKISFFWNQLSESQQEKLNRFCLIDKKITILTPMKSDEDINFVEIIYQMPKLKFIIDEYIDTYEMYYSIRNGLDGRPYFNLIRYLTFLEDDDLVRFLIEYQNIYEKIREEDS